MFKNRFARVLAFTGILMSLAAFQAPAAKADAYFVECCNAQGECNHGTCNDGNTVLNWLMLRFSGECGTTVEPPSGSGGTCTYERI